SRPRCFFELRFEESKLLLGRIIIEVYSDVAPKTCANFLAYCLGTNNGLCYKNTPFYKIINGYLCQGGDVTELNGTGSTSIYGTEFECENFNLKHNVPGILSTLYSTDNTANSKFNLTFKKLQVLDNKCAVFGKIISGLSNIYKVRTKKYL
ncbi:GSCOCG00009379001-RA-CDS, partial [Cotesia congregata]